MGTMENRTDIDDKPEPPAKRLRLPLATADDVRRELAKLYREARAGRVEVQDASRLANILQILARCIETGDLEQRIETLEGKRNGKP